MLEYVLTDKREKTNCHYIGRIFGMQIAKEKSVKDKFIFSDKKNSALSSSR
jgi:hypothetical protein